MKKKIKIIMALGVLGFAILGTVAVAAVVGVVFRNQDTSSDATPVDLIELYNSHASADDQFTLVEIFVREDANFIQGFEVRDE